MNKRLRILLIAVITLSLIILTACAEKQGNTTNVDENVNNSQENNELEVNQDNEVLKTLLPEQTGYKWVYNGFVEYGNIMVLKEINYKEPDYKYILEGEVDDLSGGESSADFSVKLQYLIQNGALLQVKEEELMMDSIFDNLIIIKGPLEVGNTWSEVASDKEGNEFEVKGTITKIELEDSKKIYDVKYEYGKDGLYEFRRIKEGVGTIQFQKPFISEDSIFEIGYSLYEDASGYN